MTPEAALDRVVHCLDRAHDTGFRAKAFQRARDVVRNTDPAEIAERAAAGTLTKLDGIGDSSAKVITEALAGEVPHYLAKLEATTQVAITPEGQRYRDALRGDCHLHSTWSDGGAEIEEMAATARALGHEYMVLTDHSARLTIAHGLDRERLRAPARRHRRDQRVVRRRRSASSPGWRSTSSRTARSTSTTTCSSGSTSSSPASTPSCAWSATR